MSRAWLEGRLDGVEPRAELDLLRTTLVQALDQDQDVTRLVQSVCRLDPVAGAELVAGSRALSSAPVVRAALGVAELLEGVLPTAGLYRRLVDLAPDAVQDVLTVAVTRHGDAGWAWRLSSVEDPGGATPLALLGRLDPDRAPHRALDHDHVEAVVRRAATGDVASLRALHDRASRSVYLDALSRTLDGESDAPVVAWTAAWHGPDVEPLFTAVARRLRTPAGKRRLARQLG